MAAHKAAQAPAPALGAAAAGASPPSSDIVTPPRVMSTRTSPVVIPPAAIVASGVVIRPGPIVTQALAEDPAYEFARLQAASAEYGVGRALLLRGRSSERDRFLAPQGCASDQAQPRRKVPS